MISKLIPAALVHLFLSSCNQPVNLVPQDFVPDTTGHKFIWQLDSIGLFQSTLRGVWGSSTRDVYAVGFVEVPDDQIQSNVLRYDGTGWHTVVDAAFDEEFTYGEFSGVYGFSSTDVWIVGSNILHWDGIDWTPHAATLVRTGPTSATVITLDSTLHGNFFNAIWGTSSGNLFAVGANGIIVHYDGSGWTKMESGTSLTLYDVWGSGSTDVYAVAMDFFSAQWTVVHYDGSTWQEIAVDAAPFNRPGGVWGTNAKNVYVVSNFVSQFDGSTWKQLVVPNTIYTMTGVDGSKSNDVFVVGSFGVVMHWNGSTWHQYDELLRPDGSIGLRGVWTDGKEVFAVGSSGTQAIIIRGTRL